MQFEQMNEEDRRFFERLYEQTGGQPSRQVSMYDIGAALGWDREATSRVAQDLMATGLVEIRTLSGGVGISADGATAMQAASASGKPGASLPKLSDSRIMNPTDRLNVERVCDEIKAHASRLGLDFDTLAELMSDLKTITDQMGSPRPKTAIVREGLRSLEAILRQVPGDKILQNVKVLIGD
jgi:hypothetical protein